MFYAAEVKLTYSTSTGTLEVSEPQERKQIYLGAIGALFPSNCNTVMQSISYMTKLYFVKNTLNAENYVHGA